MKLFFNKPANSLEFLGLNLEGERMKQLSNSISFMTKDSDKISFSSSMAKTILASFIEPRAKTIYEWTRFHEKHANLENAARFLPYHVGEVKSAPISKLAYFSQKRVRCHNIVLALD